MRLSIDGKTIFRVTTILRLTAKGSRGGSLTYFRVIDLPFAPQVGMSVCWFFDGDEESSKIEHISYNVDSGVTQAWLKTWELSDQDDVEVGGTRLLESGWRER